MQYYHKGSDDRAVELLGKIVQKLVSKIARVQMSDIHADIQMSDIHADNVRVQKDANVSRLIFTDLGY
jgi:hypothetical protein